MASGLRPAVGFAPESDLGAPRDVPPSNVPLDDPGGVRRHVHQLESQKEFLRTYGGLAVSLSPASRLIPGFDSGPPGGRASRVSDAVP